MTKNTAKIQWKDIPRYTAEGNWTVSADPEYVVKQLAKWEEEEIYGLQLNPDFQRGHVWTEEQQTSWLEHFFRGGKSGNTIFFNKPSWGDFEEREYNDFVCVDGLQRLTAIRKFMNNEIPIFGGHYSKDFNFPARRNIYLTFNVNNLKTKEEVLKWYLEMNTGGTPHTEEEIERVQGLLDNLK